MTGTSTRSATARFALILGGLSAFGPLSIDMYLPAFPAMADELGATQSQIQLTLTAFLVGLAVGQGVAGPLSDSLGRRRPLVVGLILYAVTSLVCSIAPSVGWLTALRFVQGFGAAAGIVIARAAVRDRYSGVAMAKFFSVLMLVNGLGPILAPVIGAQVLRFSTWPGVFVVLTGFGVLLLLAVLLGLPETLPAERRVAGSLGNTLRTFRGLAADRVFVGYALACGLMFAAMFAYISGSSFVLQNVFDLSPQAYSLVFGVNSIGIMAMGQLNGVLLRWFAPRGLLAAGLGVAALGGIGVFVATVGGLGLFALLVPLFLVAASVGMVTPNATALALAEHPNAAGTASAFLGILQFLVGGLAAPLVGIGGTAVAMGVVIGTLDVAALIAFAVLTRSAPAIAEDVDSVVAT